MKIQLLQYTFLLFSVNLSGFQISGTINNANTNIPVEFTTVYINGTTIGTLSDTNGNFNLSYGLGSCQLIVSHASYQNEVINLNLVSDTILSIKLVPKVIPIQQVSIEHQNLRASNLKYFKEMFLGKDFWGINAVIRNESVITFIVEYYDKDAPATSLIGKPKYFEVQTCAPLIIDLPKLGYILEYDLVKYIEYFNKDIGTKVISSLGYSYFNPKEGKSKRQIKRFTKNRRIAYYYSPLHFIRSLYNQRLKENGYRLYQIGNFDTTSDDSDSSRIVDLERFNLFDIERFNPFEIEIYNYMKYHSNEAYLTGLKGNLFFIKHYHFGDEPINLDKFETYPLSKRASFLYIMNDSCTIRKDGTLPGGQIVFSKDIVRKRIGASLPSNYDP